MTHSTIADQDAWLEPYRSQFESQQQYRDERQRMILDGIRLDDYALGYRHFGLHQTATGWIFREWAPHATAIYLISATTDWRDDERFRLVRGNNGVWEITLPPALMTHGDHYKLHVYWDGGDGERIPSYATFVVQDETTQQFDAVVWQPDTPYQWRHSAPPLSKVPRIYEAHIGMSSEAPEVASYAFFTDKVLPRIAAGGYTTVQLMALQEHPYYGSFGYHVSSFFAASSRFGTPDDLKRLIDTAHGMGLRVIMDVVHSHAVKNEVEGLSRFDGTLTQYFHDGDRGTHSAWDSRTFDYGKPTVVHFLLSNLRYWLDEYQLGGFRFDGVTSMLYKDHGLNHHFRTYDDYVSTNTDLDALTYLKMATQLIHTIRPDAIIIAEDTSAFPGLAAPVSVGGVGFDYRLSMGIPDLWIKLLKEQRDENWDLGYLFHELTSHRPEERTISYAESHDQALVGDKTLLFRLVDAAMYDHMNYHDTSMIIDRGIALHKIIRLLTASTHAGGYLTFMGNEFGHPEWIDFPREGNEWSYHYARRQWSLVDNPNLKYRQLGTFDSDLMRLIAAVDDLSYHHDTVDNERRLISFMRSDWLFVFNLSVETSYPDLPVSADNGSYHIVLCSDDAIYGGHDRVDSTLTYTAHDSTIKLYLPARTAIVLRRSTL